MSQAVWHYDLLVSHEEGERVQLCLYSTKQPAQPVQHSSYTCAHTTRRRESTVDQPYLSIKRAMSSFFLSGGQKQSALLAAVSLFHTSCSIASLDYTRGVCVCVSVFIESKQLSCCKTQPDHMTITWFKYAHLSNLRPILNWVLKDSRNTVWLEKGTQWWQLTGLNGVKTFRLVLTKTFRWTIGCPAWTLGYTPFIRFLKNPTFSCLFRPRFHWILILWTAVSTHFPGHGKTAWMCREWMKWVGVGERGRGGHQT